MAASPQRIASGAGGLDDEAVRADAAALFERHRTVVEGVCRRMLRDPGEAQDAAQQAYLAAYQALLAGSRPRDGEAWLATIARHECLRRIRVRMREPLELAEEPADRSADVPEQAAASAAATLLWQEIGRLPRQQRDAVVLREFGGRSYDQVAAELGVSTPAVESLLFRARGRLRHRLQAALAALNLAPLATASAGVVARLFGSEVAPRLASPLVAKGAAITAGLAMLGGGVDATERHLDRPHPGAARPHAAPVSARPRAVAAAVAPAPTRVVRRTVRHRRPAASRPARLPVVAGAPSSVPVAVAVAPVATTVHAARVAPVAAPARVKPAPAPPPREPQAPARVAPPAVPPPVAPTPAAGDDAGSHNPTPEVEHAQSASGGGGSQEGEGSGHGDSGAGSGGSSGSSGSAGHDGHGSGSAGSGEGGSQPSGGDGGEDDGTEVGSLDASSGEGSGDPSAESSGPDQPDGDGGDSSGEGSGGSGSGEDGGHGGDSSGGDGGHSGPGGG